MDKPLITTSTSSDSSSSFSEFSSHDSVVNTETTPTLSAMSVFSPLRSSVTLSDMSNIANTLEYQNFFFDEFNSQQSSRMSRWQSDAENLNLNFNSPNQQSSSTATYLMNDFFTKRNVASLPITDAHISPMSRLSASSSIVSSNSMINQKPISQQSSRSAMTNSIDQLTVRNENINIFPSTSLFRPLPTISSHRQILSTVDNIPSTITDNDFQRVPPSFTIMQPSSIYGNTSMAHSQAQPQVLHSTTGRSNSMPTWRGHLPIKFEPTIMDQYQITTHFSQKVFLGGIPPELTEAELLLILRKFGRCNIKWPKSDGVNHNMPGFCHVVFRESRSVCELLKHCTRQQRSTIDYFLHIHMSAPTTTIRTNRLKPIQVVPWNVKDNVFVMHPENMSTGSDSSYKDWSRTIFVSPLHGKMTAFSLATVMSNVFGPVTMAQINTDKYGYPTGTGIVLFCDSHSYMRGVAAGAIDIKCDCFHKLLDIDPFLRENEPCAFCSSVADLFCRNFHCLRSYCKQCWVNQHGPKPLADHQPATRRQQSLTHV